MMCLRPVILKDRVVSCGNCLECRMIKSYDWSLRLKWEAKGSISGAFVTLTYDEENVPEGDVLTSLNKKDVQKFMMRLRYYNKMLSKVRLKYLLVGEYGERFGRPHYHLILFNCLLNKEMIEEVWKCGEVHVGNITVNSINYVCNYMSMLKGWTDEMKGLRERPFMLCSKGIGISYVEKNKDFHRKYMSSLAMTNRLERNTLPRYYLEKIFEKDELEKINEEKKLKIEKAALDAFDKIDKVDPDREMKERRKVRFEQFIKRKKMNKKL